MTSSRVDRWAVLCVALLAAPQALADEIPRETVPELVQEISQAPVTGAPVDLSKPPADTPVPLGQMETQPEVQPQPETSTPRRLVPSRQAEPAPAQMQKPQNLLGASGKSGIEVDGLGKIDNESAGVLTRQDGGFGGEMWKGLTRTQAVSLVNAIPLRSGSAALREITSLLLLSRARAPVAVGEDAPSLLAARAKVLIDMGDVDNAELLLAAAPRQGRPAGLDVVDAKVQIIRYNNARACGLARNSPGAANDDFWQRLLVYCDALDGKADSVNFGLSLLREIAGDDPSLVLLADSVISQKPIILESIERPTPVHIALSRAAKVQLPASVVETDDPLVLHSLAMAPNLIIGGRIEAAERAVPMGALSSAELRRLYQQVSFVEPDLANALTRAQEIGGAAARALLYQAAAKQNIPSARAEIILSALTLAREEGRYQAAVEAFRPLMDRLPPSPEMVWFALTGVRAYLVLGDATGTERWLALLRASATVREESSRALARVRPLARLLGVGDKSIPLDSVISAWRSTLDDTPEVSSYRALVNGMFMALGEDLPSTSWDGIEAGVAKNQLMPSPVVWFMFRDSLRALKPSADRMDAPGLAGAAAMANRGKAKVADVPPGAAKAAIYALQSMGNGVPGDQGIAVVYEVVAAFRALGFERTARKLAVETLLAAGL
ncbi:hypothetical protein L2D14_08580 [Thalassospiraceae bacterium LMO-JJ14]|nr:hypothetical protein L2D14_08580 [Thalassospiraceae bacterium LMO-JJ14]